MGAEAAIIAGAASLLGSGTQAWAQGKMNRKTRKFNEKMMEKQRTWALQDWDKVNQYNHPAQQMQRLREAGLNPHLVYGSGGATQTAQQIGSTPSADWNPRAPDIGAMISNPVNAYMETRSFQAQQKLLDAQTLKVLSDVDTSQFDLKQKQRLADTQATIMQEMATGKRLENVINAERNQREALKNAKDLEEATQRIAKMTSEIDLQDMMKQKGNEEIKNIKQMRQKVSQEINNLQKDGTIKDFEIALNKAGISKNDPLYARVAKTLVDSVGLTPEKIKEKVQQVTQGIQDGTLKSALEELFRKAFFIKK